MTLPDGPGSIEGVGDNAQLVPNMGSMTHRIPIVVPPGFDGVTPDLSLSYSSSAGMSVVGIGWSIEMPSIERYTARGLPKFTLDDEFAADGSTQLVFVGEQDGARVYRSRFEQSFVRYEWHDAGNGGGGYFLAQYPDGRVGYFGADKAGTPIAEARVEATPGQTFRYMLVDLVDPWGHVLHHQYKKNAQYPLLQKLGYAGDESAPRFSVELSYEARSDILSDASAGFELQLSERLKEVTLRSRAAVIRRYTLQYEDPATSGGLSRLAKVSQTGLNGEKYPIEWSFGYSRALGGTCSGSGCSKPFVVEMGSLPAGVNLSSGRTTLIDINGDSLPDVVSSGENGAHQIILALPSPDGQPKLSTSIVTSKMAGVGSAFRLDSPRVQALDVNGDGLTDLVSSATGEVLCNFGEGDWSDRRDCLMNPSLPEMFEEVGDVGDGNPTNMRFLDYDGDKRIDMLWTPAANTAQVYHNDGTSFAAVDVDPIGAMFDVSRLDLTDMNGDGLQDPVELMPGNVLQYKINLGYGRWTADWRQVNIPGIDETDFFKAQLEDINGDGLSDIVIVSGLNVSYSLNRNGNHFEDFVTLSQDNVEGTLPTQDEQTSVLIADMNGNGSDDIVWVQNSTGKVSFLELFPLRPNLLSSIRNGLGMEQSIEYGTAVAELARDADGDRSWQYKLRHSMNVVTRTDAWVTVSGSAGGSGLHEVQTIRYRNGYYDGEERQFRGFADVEQELHADAAFDSQEPLLTISHFDVGASDTYRNGLLLQRDLYSGATATLEPLRSTKQSFTDCALADVPTQGLLHPVRYLCEVNSETTLQERQGSDAWVVTRSEQQYDAYGRVKLERELGVLGATGDEITIARDWIAPGEATDSAWNLTGLAREARYGSDGGATQETLNYYDGEAFIGLPLGHLTKGSLSRSTQRVTSDGSETLDAVRNAFDEHGNVVQTLDPLASPDGDSEHRRRYTMDADGLNVVRTELMLVNEAGEPYELVSEYSYDDTWNKVARWTDWTTKQGSTALTPTNARSYRYDNQGRLSQQYEPGDPEGAPGVEYSYQLGDPWSQIHTKQRSKLGGELDVELTECLDGKGRIYQSRTKLRDGAWEVSGLSLLNSRGAPVRVYQAFMASDGNCSAEAPDDVPQTDYRYDGLGRELVATIGDSADFGSASTQRTEYLPLSRKIYDENDTDMQSSTADTPSIYNYDGLGRLTGIERSLEPGKTALTAIEWDDLGRIAAVSDALGNRHTQRYDLLDRPTQISDPNAGESSYAYDDAGNLTRSSNAAGQVRRRSYDGANRVVAQWDESDEDGSRVSWTYDHLADCERCSNSAGQPVEVRFPVPAQLGGGGQGHERYGYDARGNQTWTERKIGAAVFPTEQTFDGVDRLVSSASADGQVLSYAYDAGSRVRAIAGILDAVDYAPRGMPERLAYANGVETSYTYDSRQRRRTLQTKSDSARLMDLTVERDRIGNVLRVIDAAEASSPSHVSRSARYAYDAWYRVTEAALGPDTSPETLSFEYDLIDNVVRAVSDRGTASPAHVGRLSYGSKPNAVVQANSLSFDYDAAGRMTKRGDRSYSYDYLGRMVAAGTEAGPGRFVYADEGMRVAKLEEDGVVYYAGPDFEVRDGISYAYARLGDEYVARLASDALATRVLPDVDGNGSISVSDAWKLAQDGGDEPQLPALLRGAARHILFEGSEPTLFLHEDLGRSLALSTTADGSLRGQQSFYPFGEVRSSSGWVDSHGFTGQESDSSSDLTHFGARELDVYTGRWTKPDPLFEVLSLSNLDAPGEATTGYCYVANNAINSIDPTGLAGDEKGLKLTRSKKSDKGFMLKNIAAAVTSMTLGITASVLSFTGYKEAALGLSVADKTIALGFKVGIEYHKEVTKNRDALKKEHEEKKKKTSETKSRSSANTSDNRAISARSAKATTTTNPRPPPPNRPAPTNPKRPQNRTATSKRVVNKASGAKPQMRAPSSRGGKLTLRH